jgi:hypothetical protein
MKNSVICALAAALVLCLIGLAVMPVDSSAEVDAETAAVSPDCGQVFPGTRTIFRQALDGKTCFKTVPISICPGSPKQIGGRCSSVPAEGRIVGVRLNRVGRVVSRTDDRFPLSAFDLDRVRLRLAPAAHGLETTSIATHWRPGFDSARRWRADRRTSASPRHIRALHVERTGRGLVVSGEVDALCAGCHRKVEIKAPVAVLGEDGASRSPIIAERSFTADRLGRLRFRLAVSFSNPVFLHDNGLKIVAPVSIRVPELERDGRVRMASDLEATGTTDATIWVLTAPHGHHRIDIQRPGAANMSVTSPVTRNYLGQSPIRYVLATGETAVDDAGRPVPKVWSPCCQLQLVPHPIGDGRLRFSWFGLVGESDLIRQSILAVYPDGEIQKVAVVERAGWRYRWSNLEPLGPPKW